MVRSGMWVVAVAIAAATGASAAVPGPPRDLTSPRLVMSEQRPQVQPVDIPELFQVCNVSGAAWLNGGASIVYSANISGRFNVWSQSPGHEPARLTQSEQRQQVMAITADGASVVYQSDTGGNELFDLFLVSTGGGEAMNLTATPEVSETSAVIDPRAGRIAYSRKPKADPISDVAILDVKTHAVRILTREADPQFRWAPVAFSPDGRELIANRFNALATTGSIWTIDLETGARRALAPEGDGVMVAASAISPDGRSLAITSNASSEQGQAALLDLPTGRVQWLEPSMWPQSTGSFSPDGRNLAFTESIDGRSRLSLYGLVTGRIERVDMPAGLNHEARGGGSGFSADGDRLLVMHQASNAPGELWSYHLATRKADKLTRLAPAALDPVRLPTAQLVHYASRDGTVISAFLWVPFNRSRDGHAPAVVYPHGGPTGQMTDFFNREAAALASRGYVVLAPNFRGSTGYGKAFQLANIKDLGGGDLEDVLAGASFLAATGYVDPKRIGIFGGSYGGFMTLMALAKSPDVWAAGVDLFGILDWRTMLQRGDAGIHQYEMGLLGDPVTDASVYEKSSPITYLAALKAPLLVQQGENDPRVPRQETEALVAALRARGAVVDVKYYPDEGHGFAKTENQIEALTRTIDWFDQYLKPAGGAGEP